MKPTRWERNRQRNSKSPDPKDYSCSCCGEDAAAFIGDHRRSGIYDAYCAACADEEIRMEKIRAMNYGI